MTRSQFALMGSTVGDIVSGIHDVGNRSVLFFGV
jgi:hypothetical protein